MADKIFEDLYEMLKSRGEKRMIIGVVGFVGSGKTYFARELEHFLKGKKINSISMNMDIYNSSTRSERNDIISSLKNNYNPNWPRKAYSQNSELIKNHLKNIRQKKSFSAQGLCNPMTKELNFPVEFFFGGKATMIKMGDEEHNFENENLWVLCDGVKIIKYEELLDCIIFVKADYQTRFNRLLERNNKLPSPANIRKDIFDDVERNLILDHELDEKNADIVLDNNDFNNRRIIKQSKSP